MTVNEGFDIGDLGFSESGQKKAAKPKAATKKPQDRISIIIDEVAGMKNFEVVAVNGKVYQIKRGVPVRVPPEVIHVLENAKMVTIEQKLDRLSGEYIDVERTFSAIPWRRA